MKRIGTMSLLTAAAFAMVVIPSSAVAQGNLARVYQITPEPGFVAAFRAHIQWRDANDDPWSWTTYQVVFGENVGSFLVRSGGHSWADFDAYDAGFGATTGDKFNANVLPLIESISAQVTATDTLHTRLPGDGYTINLINIAAIHLKPSEAQSFNRALGKFHDAMVKHDVPMYYAVSNPVAGGVGPVVHFVGLNDSWASFAEPDPNIGAVMIQEYGEEEAGEILTRIGQAIRQTESTVLARRADLSSGGN